MNIESYVESLILESKNINTIRNILIKEYNYTKNKANSLIKTIIHKNKSNYVHDEVKPHNKINIRRINNRRRNYYEEYDE